jgi:hypothetical protein
VLALSAPVDCEPLVASAPDQPPEAVQELAFVEVQLRLVLPPLVTLVELALKLTVGADADTVTVADCVALPPDPVQVSMYLVVDVRDDVLVEPFIASLPAQPPDAEQEVAFVELQFKVDEPSLFTVLGLAARATVGAAAVTVTVADCVALPPVPVQVSA